MNLRSRKHGQTVIWLTTVLFVCTFTVHATETETAATSPSPAEETTAEALPEHNVPLPVPRDSLLTRAERSFPAYSCVLERPIYFGASVTAGYGGVLDGAIGRFQRFKDEDYIGDNLNPVAQLQRNLFGQVDTINLAEMVGGGKYAGNGTLQLRGHTKSASGRADIQRATALASLDAFYWPSTMEKCDAALADVGRLLVFAAKYKKPLIIANEPDENPELVSSLLKSAGWTKADPACVARINQRLAEGCKLDQQCYLIDMHELVQKLNAGKLVVRGQRYSVSDIRFDGVHLTELGRSLVAELIHEKLSATPPACASDISLRKAAAQRALRAHAQQSR